MQPRICRQECCIIEKRLRSKSIFCKATKDVRRWWMALVKVYTLLRSLSEANKATQLTRHRQMFARREVSDSVHTGFANQRWMIIKAFFCASFLETDRCAQAGEVGTLCGFAQSKMNDCQSFCYILGASYKETDRCAYAGEFQTLHIGFEQSKMSRPLYFVSFLLGKVFCLWRDKDRYAHAV